MKQFILIVNGPVCGGKTFLVDSIMNNYKKYSDSLLIK